VKRKTVLGVLAVLGIGMLEFFITFQLYRGIQSGSAISVRHAAAQPVLFLLQCLRECLLPAALLILFAIVLKKDFASALSFRLRGKWQRTVAAILTAVIFGFTLYGLVAKQDKASVLFSLLYYLVIVAFSEEFVIRDACTWFLRDNSWPLRYLLPNAIFALLHLFLFAEWGEISGEVLIRFFTTGTFLGYVSMGCLFQLFKEKSGSLWLPVLLHGLMDYSVIPTY
jgi:membrane protease YdiL (CAAX protease family)